MVEEGTSWPSLHSKPTGKVYVVRSDGKESVVFSVAVDCATSVNAW